MSFLCRYKIKILNKIDELYNFLPNEFTVEDARPLLSQHFAAPNKLLERLVASGQLLRLKRGLFVPVDRYDPLAAAASIHGPSYLSFETALGFYGMIPESVNAIFSVADARQLRINAGGRLYIYRCQQRSLFAQGMTAVNHGGRNILIATREKALLDTIAWSRTITRDIDPSEVFTSICASYRLNDDDLWKLSAKKLSELAPMYHSLAPGIFAHEFIKRKADRR